MPHDDLVEITATLGKVRGQATKWFMCREGHPYAIGDCGQPKQLGKCPCGAPIGGNNYAFVETGFNVERQQQADLTDKTRDGKYAHKILRILKFLLKCVFFRIHSWTLGSNGNRTAHWHPRNQQSGSCCSPICSPCKSFRSNFHGLYFYELTFFPRQTDVNVARTNPKQGIHHQIDYMQTAKRSSISERPHEIEPKTTF